mgnify:CR=1 FL=1
METKIAEIEKERVAEKFFAYPFRNPKTLEDKRKGGAKKDRKTAQPTLCRFAYLFDILCADNGNFRTLITVFRLNILLQQVCEQAQRLAARAGTSGTDWGLGALAHVRALVADDDDADALYAEAIERLITLNTTVGVYPIGATWSAHVNNSAFPRVDVTQLTGFQAASGQVATNFGMACYNARAGLYALLLRTGTSGANYRLHIFPIGQNVRAHTTYAELLAAFQAAMSGYRFVDITLSGLSYTGTEDDRYAHRLCLCDDGTLWIVVTDTSNTTSGAQGLRVFRIASSVMSVTDALTLTQHVQSATNAAHYGLGAGAYYATRFLLSDDQSVMAVYTHHTRYLSGAVGRFLPTDSVNNTALGCRGFLYNDSSYGFSIAPVGGSAFAICRGHDKNSAQAHLWFLDPRFSTLAETGSDTTMRTVVGAYPQREDSTMYQGQFVNKILPLDRFK